MTGGLALFFVMYQMAAPMLNPAPSVGDQIGTIAGDIKRSAWRAFLGMAEPQPEPVSRATYSTAILGFVAPALGVIAVFLSIISAINKENRRYMQYGTSMGAAAIAMHFVWWLALLIVGAMILVAIIENIGDIFSF
ncbi:hypothetical protein ACG74X_18645 [Marivita sp. S0852]